jgi:Xaa-Pro dipeptidase
MKDRVRKVFAHLEASVDAIVLANSVDPHLDQSFFYLFDVPSGLFEGSVVVARRSGEIDLFTSPLEAQSAEEAAAHDRSVTVHRVERGDGTEAEVGKLLDGAKAVGLNFAELTHAWFTRLDKMRPGTQWVDASVAFRKTRVVKDAGEIERLRKAAEIGSKVGVEIPSMLRRGMTELELASEIEYRMGRLGASGRSFSTIVAFGPHGAEPHYQPGATRLEPGVSIVCDYGAFYRRYASDITRSYRFGPADPEMRLVHETVERAQQAALEAIRPGVPGKEVHLAAERVIDASPFKGRLIHGVGHSIGLAVHDGWGYNPKVDDPLEEGMVITVEPGIYLPGKGGVRIEDDVVVTRTGYEFLSTAPRGYLEVAS